MREVAGLMPYEKRILDMIKTGGASAEKRIYKFAKRRVSLESQASFPVCVAVRHAVSCFAKLNSSASSSSLKLER